MNARIKPNPTGAPSGIDPSALQAFVEDEADLLDRQDFDAWLALFDEDGTFWVPAQKNQPDPLSHVSVFFDDKTILTTRVARLKHDMIHCQDPPSSCVRVVSNIRQDTAASEATEGLLVVLSKFIMLEDRQGSPRRIFGGRYRHVLRPTPAGLRIVQKKVELTNCDQSFPALSQPF